MRQTTARFGKVGLFFLIALVATAVSLLAVGAPPTGPSAPPSTPTLVPGLPLGGSFSSTDLPLETVLPQEAGDTTPADLFLLQGSAGQAIRLTVEATVPVYLALVAPNGERLAGAGTQGDNSAPVLEHVLGVAGVHTVVVNSFHGDSGTYTVTLGGSDGSAEAPPLTGTFRSLPAAGDVGLVIVGSSVDGRFEPGDQPLEVLVPGNEGDLTWADAVAVDGVSGQGLRIEARSNVPIYLALLDSAGNLLAGDGVDGDESETRILWVPVDNERFRIVVNSYNGDPGTYALSVSVASTDDLAELSDSLPIDATLAPGRPLDDAVAPADRIYRTYVVDVPEGASTLTISTRSSHNIDLFVRQGVQIISSWNTEPDFSGTSPGGDETVRINELSDPALAAGRYYVDVVAFDVDNPEASAPVPFTVSAEVTQTVIPVIVDVVPVDTEGMVTGMFAAQLSPGRRVAARIEPSVSPLQVWSVPVSPSANRLELRTFNASGRLDLVVAPPGVSLPATIGALLDLPHRAITARDNERLVIDGSTSPPLAPGAYTVAVLDLYSEVASDYEIAAALDDELVNTRHYEAPSPEELAALEPVDLALRATVQLTLSLEEGGLEFGSGTLVTPDGLILTNHHVVGQCDHSSPYLLGCIGDVYRSPDGSGIDIFVGLSGADAAIAEQHFIARVVRTLPDYDLALLQIVSDLEGRPLDIALPFLPLDVSGNLHHGDAVSVIGYPGVAGLGSRISLSMTRGAVTGFTDDRGQRVFINVDANIAGGNSGGALIDQRGVLVGVPSNQNLIRERGERQDYARSLSLLPDEWRSLIASQGGTIL